MTELPPGPAPEPEPPLTVMPAPEPLVAPAVPKRERGGWGELFGLERRDLLVMGIITVFAFILRFFSPIYPDFLTHPTAWPPIKLSSPAYPVQQGSPDSNHTGKISPCGTIDLSPPCGEVFDEIYFADFAHKDITGEKEPGGIHTYFDPEPPTAKLLIAVGEILFGFNTFGWRFMSVIFGTILVAAMYLLAHRLWRNRFFAGTAAFLTAIDGMMLVQSRIAMIDVFVVTFTIITYYFFFLHLAAKTRSQSLVTLFLTGGFLGLAVSSKWIALAALATMLAILAWRHWTSMTLTGAILALTVAVGTVILRGPGSIAAVAFIGAVAMATLALTLAYRPLGFGWREEGTARGPWIRAGAEAEPGEDDPFDTEEEPVVETRPAPGRIPALTYGAFVGIALVVMPALLYVASFWRWLMTNNWDWNGLIDLHHQIWQYHSQLRATHPYGSPWYTWPFLLRPVAYFYQGTGLGTDTTGLPLVGWLIKGAAHGNAGFNQPLVAGIINMGNPAIWWGADVAMAVLLIWALRRRQMVPAFIVLAFLTAWLPWAPVSRVLFLYHMFGGLPFMILALAYALSHLHRTVLRVGTPRRHLRIYGSDLAYGMLSLCLVAFLYWYPVWTAAPISNPAYLGNFPGGKMWLQGSTGSGGGYSWTFGWI
ncbi:MAG: phospholipid carrier-dependent glycosyltransferase [Candidatus Dormibacteria bacterium]